MKTAAGLTYTRGEVVASLDAGEVWQTKSPSAHSAKIERAEFCPASGCLVTPYIRTRRDQYADDNLDNLPSF